MWSWCQVHNRVALLHVFHPFGTYKEENEAAAKLSDTLQVSSQFHPNSEFIRLVDSVSSVSGHLQSRGSHPCCKHDLQCNVPACLQNIVQTDVSDRKNRAHYTPKIAISRYEYKHVKPFESCDCHAYYSNRFQEVLLPLLVSHRLEQVDQASAPNLKEQNLCGISSETFTCDEFINCNFPRNPSNSHMTLIGSVITWYDVQGIFILVIVGWPSFQYTEGGMPPILPLQVIVASSDRRWDDKTIW